MREYLAEFRPWNYTHYDWYYPPVYAESTPFYIASRDACQRMAKDIPGTKMIVLLREPVARAYSEYHMKKRRVDQQNEFIALLQQYERETSKLGSWKLKRFTFLLKV